MEKYVQMVEKLSLEDLFSLQNYQEDNLDKWKNSGMKNTEIGEKFISDIENKLKIIQQQIDNITQGRRS